MQTLGNENLLQQCICPVEHHFLSIDSEYTFELFGAIYFSYVSLAGLSSIASL
jgi:hypothetical protein